MDTQSVEDLLDTSPNLEYTTNWYDADMVLEITPLATLGLPLAENCTFKFSTEN